MLTVDGRLRLTAVSLTDAALTVDGRLRLTAVSLTDAMLTELPIRMMVIDRIPGTGYRHKPIN